MDIRLIDANALDDQLGVSDRDIYVKDCLNEQPTITLNDLRDEIYADAVAHGLWEEADQYAERRSAESMAIDKEKERLYFRNEAATELVLDEAEELFTAAYHDNYENMTEELADVVIQAFSTAGYLGLDIDAAIRRKMEINKGKPWKHGKE